MSRRWQQLVSAALDGVYPALEAMTDAELRLVRGAKKRATTANCWWLGYHWLPQLSEIADMLLRHRYRTRRLAAAEAKRHMRTKQRTKGAA